MGTAIGYGIILAMITSIVYMIFKQGKKTKQLEIDLETHKKRNDIIRISNEKTKKRDFDPRRRAVATWVRTSLQGDEVPNTKKSMPGVRKSSGRHSG